MSRAIPLLTIVLCVTSCTDQSSRVHLEPGQVIVYECIHKTQRSSKGPGGQADSSEQTFPYRVQLEVDRVEDGTTYLRGHDLNGELEPTGEPFDWAVDAQGRFQDSSGMRFDHVGYSFDHREPGASADEFWRKRWLGLLDIAPSGDFESEWSREIVLLFVPARVTARLDWTVAESNDTGWHLTATGIVLEWADPTGKTTMTRGSVTGRAHVSKQDGLLHEAKLALEIDTEGPREGRATKGTLDVTLKRVAR